MKEYKINFTANTITISKSFADAASDPTSAECEKLSKLQAAYPGMRIVHKTHRSPSKANVNKGLTYDRMEGYINLHENAAELLTTFKTVKEIAAKQKNPYQFTKGWFMQQFPDYGKLPNISDNGKILYVLPVDPPAAEKDGDVENSTAAEHIEFAKVVNQ
ncbi:MAG: hypothetical protein HDT14_10585 [Oscillibacter sp.]|nr:hypothetical protein [Oscillibacter sp.]